MGNSLRRLLDTSCVDQCFGRRYQRWKQALEADNYCGRVRDDPGRHQQASLKYVYIYIHREAGRRNRIAEYIAWAVSRSRSPLLLDDALAGTPVEVHSNEFGGVNSVSWISDTTGSEASHALYREMDPYNYAPVAGSLMPSPTSCSSSLIEGTEASNTGGWVAVTRLSDSKDNISTSALHMSNAELLPHGVSVNQNAAVPTCDEEVDGLELTRLGRSLWRKPALKQSSLKKVFTSRSVPDRQLTVMVTSNAPYASRVSNKRQQLNLSEVDRTAPAVRPSALSLKQVVPRLPGSDYSTVDSSQFRSGPLEMQSPIELDWDHELDTEPLPPRKEAIPMKSSYLYDSSKQCKKTSTTSPITNGQHGFTDVKLYPARPRRRTQNITALPVTETVVSDAHTSKEVDRVHKWTNQSKRWSYSDRLIPISSRTQPISPLTAIPCANLIVSPDSPSRSPPPSDELVDSGFAGLSSSFVECDLVESMNDDRMSEFLWEHEMFTEPARINPFHNATVR
ncbi:hypothetical protein EG68_03217 [Paragonimus skrjabini miyazakii]|uniref:Uncharacterized protein n=1 Tax=Paragonimus skrjabini miyazakii TaxID=59628 RepID=A0A8S9YWQ8_9TREM|nr:hypothetical protein EG68_03217 [Paragonimus skrjabini miyazakii]